MKNKFIKKLEIVQKGINDFFEKIKKNFSYFSHAMRLTFTSMEIERAKKKDAKKQQKKFKDYLKTQAEKEAQEKKSENETVKDEVKAETKTEEKVEQESETKIEEKTESENAETKQETEKGIYITPSKVARFSLHFLDFVASIIFISALVIALRPELLQNIVKTYDINTPDFIQNIGKSFLNVDISRISIPLDDWYDCIEFRNVIVACALAAYVFFKLIIILLCKDSNKIISLLLLVLFVLLGFLAGGKFLIFIIFAIVLYLTFQIACFMPTKAIVRKLGWLIVFTLVGYFIACLALLPEFASALVDAFSKLKLPNVTLF